MYYTVIRWYYYLIDLIAWIEIFETYTQRKIITDTGVYLHAGRRYWCWRFQIAFCIMYDAYI